MLGVRGGGEGCLVLVRRILALSRRVVVMEARGFTDEPLEVELLEVGLLEIERPEIDVDTSRPLPAVLFVDC